MSGCVSSRETPKLKTRVYSLKGIANTSSSGVARRVTHHRTAIGAASSGVLRVMRVAVAV